ncbi:signal transduction histidine kinase [Brevundimonas alba]|uniref:histidine kinase n=1 Tax=Brevundimonas alba TaxID=74314 RepID=A0A7X6BMX0_9CAUL|nr:ATP-binding protein [Brevundimonas alba]NJC41543.1 signal transduction histidine kinase [Brevundimonas alba]
MKRPSSLPVLVQVAALAAFAVVMSQAVAFGVVVLAPEPRPAGFSIEAAADALKGDPARTSDGRELKRRITDDPVSPDGVDRVDPMALAISAGLANRLGVEQGMVRVSVDRRRGPRPSPPPHEESGAASFVFVRPDAREGRSGGSNEVRVVTKLNPDEAHRRAEMHMRHFAPRGDDSAIVLNSTTREFTILTDRLTFAPFSASVRQADGRWATVEPPHGLLSPWQQRVLLALGISMLLLAPLVWWLARRLTRPIRVFAEAAERLGANPDAEPLAPSGPSEVRTAIHAFNDMQASLRNHMRQRTQTIAAIAHDLRTPLTRLRFRAEQASETVRDRMASDIEEMDALIAQAMAFVRGETTPDRREPLDLDALAADCAGGFAETGAAVRFDGGGALPVEGDAAGLRRALGNLIENAVKYGGAARVKAFARDGRAIVEVEDDGPGLDESELEAVFEPFHRAERSRSRETGGAGLGLTVARQAARAHGGDVVLIRRTEGGLTARLDLPLASTVVETR